MVDPTMLDPVMLDPTSLGLVMPDPPMLGLVMLDPLSTGPEVGVRRVRLVVVPVWDANVRAVYPHRPQGRLAGRPLLRTPPTTTNTQP